MMDQAAIETAISWLVPAEVTSVRLDSFVRRRLPYLSRRKLDQAIAEKLFWVNGRAGKKGDRLAAGDRLAFLGPAHWLAERPSDAAHLHVPVVYEDASILALDKPAGLPTHGFSARDGATLANLIAARWPELLNIGKSRWEPGLVHRLDVETSGLILVAKTQTAFDSVRAQFRRREIRKTYWALVWGNALAEGVIDFALTHDSRDRRKMRIVSSARNPKRAWRALTTYRKLGSAPGLSLLEIEMATGVTHQIRVHLAAIGHPIVGDGLYGGVAKSAIVMRRHFLHAKRLVFCHPDDGRSLTLDSELPSELSEVLTRVGIDS
ncbi:MAG: RluA family pseudouridine synthase [Candidatus Binatia bacterium]